MRAIAAASRVLGAALAGLSFAASTPAAPPAGAADGVTRAALVVGQTISLQQGRNAFAAAVQDGITAYLKHANEQGGVHGRQVVLRTLDDDGANLRAEANARELVQKDNALVLFGSLEGGPSMAVAKVANELQVPFFGPMAGAPGLRRPHSPLVFPVRAEHRDEFRALLEHARSLGMTRVAFFRADNDTGLQHLGNVKAICSELKLDLVADLPYKAAPVDAELAGLVRQIGTSAAHVVLNHGSAALYENLIRKSRAAGIKANFVAVNSGSAQLAERLGELAHGMVFSQVVPSPTERKTALAREYREVFARHFPAKPFSYGSLEGYVTAKALVAALKLAGPAPTRESFAQGILKAGVLDINGIKAHYKPGEHTGFTLVDLAIFTRESRFMH